MKQILGNREYESFLNGILSWIYEYIDYFDPPQEDEILDATPEYIPPGKRRKAFGELGAALRLTTRIPDLAHHHQVRQLVDQWVDLTERRNLFFDIRRRVQLFPHRVVACANLKAFGYPITEIQESLQLVLDREFIDRVELSAWHKLDMKYYMDLIDLQHCYGSDEALFHESTLTRLPALPYATNYDLYGLTHLLFHFSDFGARDIRPLLAQHYDSICDYTGLALSTCLSMQDWDLTAELLISRICLGIQDHSLDQEAAQALRCCQQDTGFIPGRAWMAGAFSGNQSQKHPEDEFFDIYHPTLVALFLVCCDMYRESR